MEDHKRELFIIFFAQKDIILKTTLIIFIATILIAFFWPPVYVSTGSIIVKGKRPEKSPEALEREEIRLFRITKEDLYSEVQILTSPDVIKATIDELKEKKQYPEKIESSFTDKLPFLKRIKSLFETKEKQNKYDPAMDNEIKKIKGKLKTEIITASNVIKVSLFDKSPDDASVILTELMRQYIIYQMKVYNPAEAASFFSDQVEKYKSAIEDMEDKLDDLVTATKSANPQKEIENNLIIKKELETTLNTLRSESTEKKLFIEMLDKALNSDEIHYFSFIENNLSIKDLSNALHKLVLEEGTIRRKFHPKSAKAVAIKEQVGKTYEELKSEVTYYKESQESKLLTINEKIDNLESKIKDIIVKNIELYKQLTESRRIKRETEVLSFSYKTFAKRKEEADLKMNVNPAISNVGILNRPFPNYVSVFPKKKTMIPLGLIAGFITGCSLGFLKEYFDHTFKKPNDAVNYVDLPVIFSIPSMAIDLQEEEKKQIAG